MSMRRPTRVASSARSPRGRNLGERDVEGQQHVAQAAEFWVFCADFNRNLQICPDAQLGLAEQLLRLTDLLLERQKMHQ